MRLITLDWKEENGGGEVLAFRGCVPSLYGRWCVPTYARQSPRCGYAAVAIDRIGLWLSPYTYVADTRGVHTPAEGDLEMWEDVKILGRVAKFAGLRSLREFTLRVVFGAIDKYGLEKLRPYASLAAALGSVCSDEADPYGQCKPGDILDAKRFVATMPDDPCQDYLKALRGLCVCVSTHTGRAAYQDARALMRVLSLVAEREVKGGGNNELLRQGKLFYSMFLEGETCGGVQVVENGLRGNGE
jgi:hypothetical protein